MLLLTEFQILFRFHQFLLQCLSSALGSNPGYYVTFRERIGFSVVPRCLGYRIVPAEKFCIRLARHPEVLLIQNQILYQLLSLRNHTQHRWYKFQLHTCTCLLFLYVFPTFPFTGFMKGHEIQIQIITQCEHKNCLLTLCRGSTLKALKSILGPISHHSLYPNH